MAPTTSPATVTDAEVTRCTNTRTLADVARQLSTNVSDMPMWGTDVVDGHYAGHRGLLYEPRPHSFRSLLEGTARFGDRTFLVQGERRIPFAAFNNAIATGRRYLRRRGIKHGDRVLL